MNSRQSITGRWIVAWVMCFCKLAPLFAASSISLFTARTWQTDDGLPQNSVQTILQTRDGYLWTGTQRGLARFDGVRFVVFEDVPEVKGRSITALCEGSDGSFWVAIDGGGLARCKEGLWSHYGKADGLADDAPRTLFKSSDGSIWIGGSSGLTQYKDGKFVSVAVPGTAQIAVRSLAEDASGNLWLATSEGLKVLTNGMIKDIDTPLISNAVRSLCRDGTGNLWVGYNGRLTRMKNGEMTHYTQKEGLLDITISSIYEDRRGNLWIGTYGGLNRMVENRLITETNNRAPFFDVVYSVYEDRESNLWVGSKSGLTRLSAQRFTAYAKPQGLTHNATVSILEDKGAGFWIGTWGGGLNYLRDNTVTSYTVKSGLSSDLILGLHEDRQGNLWIGMDYDGGVNRFKNGQFTRYRKAEGMLDAALSVIIEDRQGNLWMGARGALYAFRDEKFTRYTLKDGLAGDTVRSIVEDNEGSLWIGTNRGLTRRKNGRFDQFTNEGLTNVIVSIYEDKNHDLWLGTDGAGLNRLKVKSDERHSSQSHFPFDVSRFTMKDGLFSDTIYEILEDDFGYLWMSCHKGIFRVSKKDLDDFVRGITKHIPCNSFGKNDGMASTECVGVAKPAGWKSKDGRLWFTTSKGVVALDPNVNANETPPPVLIEEVVADKQKATSGEGRVTSHPVTRHSSPVTVPAGRVELEIHYTALSFTAPEKNRFKYKLTGWDTDWIDAGDRRVAFYNKVPPGSYTFQVLGCNNDGVWNSEGSNVKLTLLPHFWQTWWFKVCLGLTGCSALGLAYHIRVSRIRELEQLRFRIAGDLHDDVGASLTKIAMLTEIAARKPSDSVRSDSAVREIAATNRHVIRSIQEIVWTIKPKNDALDIFVSFLIRHAQDYFQDTGIRCRLDIPPELPDYILPTETRHNLFLVFKEALNNAAKHSNASEVSVAVSLIDRMLFVTVSDNGRGFDVRGIPSAGNGLANMRRRIENIGGKFVLESAPGKGTSIRFGVSLYR